MSIPLTLITLANCYIINVETLFFCKNIKNIFFLQLGSIIKYERFIGPINNYLKYINSLFLLIDYNLLFIEEDALRQKNIKLNYRIKDLDWTYRSGSVVIILCFSRKYLE